MNEREKHALEMQLEEMREEMTLWEDYKELCEKVDKIERFLRVRYREEWDSFE